jgi:NDP-sugar pyrophosphorylase family protein
MTVIVTMAGAGSRFRAQGYEVPKHMIRARGKTLFEWSMESLQDFFSQHFIFACLEEHDSSWIKFRAAAMGIRQITVLPRATISLGQAQTAYDVLDIATPDETVWIYNIDTYIEHGLSLSDMAGHQGCVHVFESSNPGMSFVRYDEDGRVVELAEKKVISNWATVGVYGFSSADLYRQLYQESYQRGGVKEVRGERYVAPMYQLLLKAGKSVCAPRLDCSAVHILGTPAEVLTFDPCVRPPHGS